MNKITESDIEKYTIELIEKLGYHYLRSDQLGREHTNEVLLKAHLSTAVHRINPNISETARQQAIDNICRFHHSEQLISNNEIFHWTLANGINVTQKRQGEERGDYVSLIDFDNPENNDFLVCNQFTIIENHNQKRPDIILFVNGLPLVVIELKNPADENATVKSAYQQIETYKSTIPSLFTYNELIIISDGLEAKAGSLSADFSRFMAWKSSDGKTFPLISELETLINGLLNKITLLDLIKHFVVFENVSKINAQGIISVEPVKKIAAYHQYYAVNKAIDSTLRACGFSASQGKDQIAESPENYGLPSVAQQAVGDRKAGVIWHTQGSGKSLSMVFYAGKMIVNPNLKNPTLVIITDRNDLDDQLFNTFAACEKLLRQTPVQAESREQLKKLLKVASGGIIFTTIQKFQPETGNIHEELSSRQNIIVIADEAHRTQYGFVKFKDIADENGVVQARKAISNAGFAQHLRNALPNATYLGFTGTPIEKIDVNTPRVFGDYVDIYDISQAVADGATVRIFYESRLAKINLSDEGKQLVTEFDEALANDEPEETQKLKSKWTQLEILIGSPERLKTIAKDIMTHFEARQEIFMGKGMIVCMSRRIAVDLYQEMITLKPEWHSDDLSKGVIKVVMTAASSDGAALSKHHTLKSQRQMLANRMKNNRDELKLVIVCDMWLTGFDVPSLHTLYLDKPMQGHNLMQAIARVNRVYGEKPAGLIVDFLGIAADLKEALSFYANAGGTGEPSETQAQAVMVLLEKLEIVRDLYYSFDYSEYFAADTGKKLSLILAATEHVLNLEDGKKRYLNHVTALSQAFAIAIPHDKAIEIRDEVAFFQAVKARLVKFSEETDENEIAFDREAAIKQVIDKALVSEKVIDIFGAAGIKKPDISIFSDEFLAEVRGMQHKNLALELLKKLLNMELKNRSKINLVQSKSLLEMLQEAIRKYQNKLLTATEVIEELIAISKEVVASDQSAQTLGLTEFEFAFYTAVANNQSARELMQQEKLLELAIDLTKKIRENATLDWTIRESARAGLRVAVKRTLRKFGYPPDMAELAVKTVVEQAEILAEELMSGC